MLFFYFGGFLWAAEGQEALWYPLPHHPLWLCGDGAEPDESPLSDQQSPRGGPLAPTVKPRAPADVLLSPTA